MPITRVKRIFRVLIIASMFVMLAISSPAVVQLSEGGEERPKSTLIAVASATPPDDLSKPMRAWTQVVAQLKLGQRDLQECPTYLEEGIRWLYCHWIMVMDLNEAKSLTGVSVFLSGPHHSKVNFESATHFGHYNPEWLKRMTHSVVSPLLKDPIFVILTQPLYDRYLKGMLRSYLYTYHWLNQGHRWAINPIAVKYHKKPQINVGFAELKGLYLKALSAGTRFDLQEAFRSPTEDLELIHKGALNKLRWYHLNTALSWWTRRSLDRTAEAFYKILRMMLKTYDSDFHQAEVTSKIGKD